MVSLRQNCQKRREQNSSTHGKKALRNGWITKLLSKIENLPQYFYCNVFTIGLVCPVVPEVSQLGDMSRSQNPKVSTILPGVTTRKLWKSTGGGPACHQQQPQPPKVERCAGVPVCTNAPTDTTKKLKCDICRQSGSCLHAIPLSHTLQLGLDGNRIENENLRKLQAKLDQNWEKWWPMQLVWAASCGQRRRSKPFAWRNLKILLQPHEVEVQIMHRLRPFQTRVEALLGGSQSGKDKYQPLACPEPEILDNDFRLGLFFCIFGPAFRPKFYDPVWMPTTNVPSSSFSIFFAAHFFMHHPLKSWIVTTSSKMFQKFLSYKPLITRFGVQCFF